MDIRQILRGTKYVFSPHLVRIEDNCVIGGTEGERNDGSGPSMHCSATATVQCNEVGDLQMHVCFTTYQENLS